MIKPLKEELNTSYQYKIRVLANITAEDALSEYNEEDLNVDFDLDTSYNGLSLPSLNQAVASIPEVGLVTITEAYIEDDTFNDSKQTGTVDLEYKMNSNEQLSEEDIESISNEVAEFLVEETCMLLISGEYSYIDEYNDYSRADYLGEREVTTEVDETAYVYVDTEVEYLILEENIIE